MGGQLKISFTRKGDIIKELASMCITFQHVIKKNNSYDGFEHTIVEFTVACMTRMRLLLERKTQSARR